MSANRRIEVGLNFLYYGVIHDLSGAISSSVDYISSMYL
jgi:hypothetical protein